MSEKNPPVPTHPLGRTARTLLGIYLVALPILLGYLVFAVWPPSEVVSASSPTANLAVLGASEIGGATAGSSLRMGLPAGSEPPITLFGGIIVFNASGEVRLILLVMVVGALGSYIHGATSFADFVGNRSICSSWLWWYVLRTFVGLSLALLFYFVMRGGLFSASSDAENISAFGVAAVSGLVGLFAKQATDKLREVSDTLLKTTTPVERADPLTVPGSGSVAGGGTAGDGSQSPQNGGIGRTNGLVGEPTDATLTSPNGQSATPPPAPRLTAIEPSSIGAGNTNLSLKIVGEHFLPESRVHLNGTERQTILIDPTHLSATLVPEDVATPGEVLVTVVNPASGGGASSPITLVVTG